MNGVELLKTYEIFQENYAEYLKALNSSINCLSEIFDKAWDVKNNNGNDDIAAYYLTYAPEMLQDIGFVYDHLKEMATDTKVEDKRMKEIRNMAELEPKRGEWIESNKESLKIYKCSCCGYWVAIFIGTPEENGYNYCPGCGADMRGGFRRKQGTCEYKEDKCIDF